MKRRGRTEAGQGHMRDRSSGATREDLVVVSFWWAEKRRFEFAGVLPAKRRFLQWRDPDSNRGHHDFQSCMVFTATYRHVREKRINTPFCDF
jgi:hypothetical protein